MQKTNINRRLSIYKELLHHRQLAEKRSLFHGKNQAAKIALAIVGIIIFIYLIFLAVSLALAVSKDPGLSPAGTLFSLAPFLLTVDFLLRFALQQTPAQMIRPYSLLPLPRHACIESFLLSNLLSAGNFVWQAMIIPYTLMAILPREGILMAAGTVLAYQFIIWLSSQFYLLVRTRMEDSLLWLLLPLVLIAVLMLPAYAGTGRGWEQYLTFYSLIGNHLARLNGLYWLGLIAGFVLLFFLNRKEQESHVMKELSRQDTGSPHKARKYQFLDRFGMAGTAIQLEFKLIFRNKNPRKTFYSVIFYILLNFILYLSTGLAGKSGTLNWNANFWCFICFIIPGSILSSRLMGYEGNYIDFYMVHKNNLYQLLLTKYYCYGCLLCLSVAVSLIALLMGRWSLLMIIAYTLYTAGPNNLMILHAAILNDQTIPLNTRLTSRTSNSYNYVILLFQLGAILMPVIILALFNALFNPATAYWALLLFSIPFILSHKWWIRQICRKMMKRKYEHLENFRASR
ncbi:MAG: DUF5687 family protein [Prevotella sp.]|jgi:hypothetical protein|nr:DUF5687 family protein [Prevotella sp.]MCH3985136.1 DUF5687 family protein [Prevotella sp.]MCH4185806.1 DUF5687 family protein [Prevotella sp.]MCH4251032.1 DUF5687 family protein [Prevotella sp.]MCI1291553.1 DUF5687 family protein [Prevotella sp.]